jgi:hypothetical protein
MKNIEHIIGMLDDKVDPNQYEGDIRQLVADARKELAELARLEGKITDSRKQIEALS